MTRFLLKTIPAVVLANLLALPATALTVYSDRPTFDGDAPGLTLEDFEGGLIGPGDIIGCDDVISAASNDACFAPGDIVPGIAFTFANGAPANGMIAIGAGAVGNATTVIGPNFFADDLDVMLTVVGGANAIGMDILAAVGAGALDVEVFGAGGSLGEANLVFVGGDTQFVGFIANEPITQILFNDFANDIGELIDDVAFGNTLSVPEPTTLALLGLGLVGAGFSRRRRT